VGKRPSGPNPKRAAPLLGEERTLPVESQTWEELHDVLQKMDLDLPTEAQWEYAARAGTTTIWWTGDHPKTLAGAGNLADASNQRRLRRSFADRYVEWLDDGAPAQAPVGSYRPNPFGLHDVIGNVAEFCLDAFGSYADPARPGTGEREGGDPWAHALRGGSWWCGPAYATSATRIPVAADYRHFHAGVRPARAIRP
jgi:formylglycine-generating enzyme required for sulfatase activity